MPGRPILSGNGHPTEWVSAWGDTQLQPLMLAQPTYLKDTSHLLTLLDNHTLTPNSRILSLDVKSLYTNIPRAEGIDSIRVVGHKLMPETDFHTISVLAKQYLQIQSKTLHPERRNSNGHTHVFGLCKHIHVLHY